MTIPLRAPVLSRTRRLVMALLLALLPVASAQAAGDTPRAPVKVWLIGFVMLPGGDLEPVIIERRIEATPRILDATLRELFIAWDQGDFWRDRYLGRPVSAWRCPERDETTWDDWYRGVVVEDGTAVVDFRPEARRLLNGAAATQQVCKTSIEETARQFPSVERVEYTIDGVVVDGWDA